MVSLCTLTLRRHSLVLSEGLHRALIYRLLGTPVYAVHSSLVLYPTDCSHASCCELWRLPGQLIRTTMLCSDSSSLLCSEGNHSQRAGAIVGLTLQAYLLSGITVMCCLLSNARKLLPSIFCSVLCLFCFNGGRNFIPVISSYHEVELPLFSEQLKIINTNSWF